MDVAIAMRDAHAMNDLNGARFFNFIGHQHIILSPKGECAGVFPIHVGNRVTDTASSSTHRSATSSP